MDSTEALVKYFSGDTRFSEVLPEAKDYMKGVRSATLSTTDIADALIELSKNKILTQGALAQARGGKPAIKS